MTAAVAVAVGRAVALASAELFAAWLGRAWLVAGAGAGAARVALVGGAAVGADWPARMIEAAVRICGVSVARTALTLIAGAAAAGAAAGAESVIAAAAGACVGAGATVGRTREGSAAVTTSAAAGAKPETLASDDTAGALSPAWTAESPA